MFLESFVLGFTSLNKQVYTMVTLFFPGTGIWTWPHPHAPSQRHITGQSYKTISNFGKILFIQYAFPQSGEFPKIDQYFVIGRVTKYIWRRAMTGWVSANASCIFIQKSQPSSYQNHSSCFRKQLIFMLQTSC